MASFLPYLHHPNPYVAMAIRGLASQKTIASIVSFTMIRCTCAAIQKLYALYEALPSPTSWVICLECFAPVL